MFADRKQNPPEVCFPQNTRHFHKISRTSIFGFLLRNFDLSKYLGTFTLHVDESGDAIANNDAAIFAQAEIVAVHAGANMDLGSVEDSKPHVEAQAQELVRTLKPLVEAEKKVFVIDPVAGPLVKEAPGGHHWALIRKRMKQVAKESKATWISLQHVDWVPEEDVDNDGTHYSKSGTGKIMAFVGEKIKEETAVDTILNMEMQEKPYEAIYRGHYKFGCYKCTRVHERGPCPPLPEAVLNSSNDSLNNSTNSSNDSSLEADGSVIAAGVHNISDALIADSWADDDDATPTNITSTSKAASAADKPLTRRPRCASEATDGATSASAAIASYTAVAAAGAKAIEKLNNTRDRSTSAKRDRENGEEDISTGNDKRNRTKDTERNAKGIAAKSGGAKSQRK